MSYMMLALRCTALFSLSLLTACAAGPQSDASDGAQALKKLPNKQGERVAVSIYEFRSSVTEISARGTTDIFKTALVQSGKFRVVERARLNEGVMREKQLNASALSSGNTARQKLRGASYIFEGSITEANPSESQHSGSFGIGGASINGGGNRDFIGIDVRIVDAANGDVIDAISVRKAINSTSSGISGVGYLIGGVLAREGKSTALVPDLNVQQQRKESLDAALRAAVNEAVNELAKRF